MNAIERATEAVLDDLSGRKGIGNEIEQVDDDVLAEIKETLAAIIKRELEKAVPAKVPTDARYPDEYDRGHNECRKAFLGEAE